MEIKVPVLPESVADATIATWHVKTGEAVSRDQVLVDIETDKVVLEVVAQADGVMGEIVHAEGATVLAEQVIGHLNAGATAAAGRGPLRRQGQSQQHRRPPTQTRIPAVDCRSIDPGGARRLDEPLRRLLARPVHQPPNPFEGD